MISRHLCRNLWRLFNTIVKVRSTDLHSVAMRGTEDKIREPVSVREDTVQYMLGEIKLLKPRKAAREVQEELRTAEDDLQSSYPGEPGLPRF